MKKKLLSTGVITTCLLSMAISASAYCRTIDTTYDLTRGLTMEHTIFFLKTKVVHK